MAVDELGIGGSSTNKSMPDIIDGSRLDEMSTILDDEEPLFVEVATVLDDEEQSVGESI